MQFASVTTWQWKHPNACNWRVTRFLLPPPSHAAPCHAVPNDSDVPVVCSKPPGGWGTLTISLGTSAQPATAVANCVGTMTTTADVTAIPPPVVDVSAVPVPVCSDGPTSTSYWTVGSTPATPMKVQLDSTEIICTMYQGATVIRPNQGELHCCSRTCAAVATIRLC
jgi:hypothetical protein